jgi:hypothetical protein
MAKLSNKKTSWEQFCLWTSLQNFPIHVMRASYIDVLTTYGTTAGLPNISYKPITNTTLIRARLCKLQKRCTRLAAASDKVYQLLAHVGGSLRILRLYIDVLTTYGTTAMSVVRNFVNDPYWLIDFFIFFCCFNATFSNISAILWLPVLVVEDAIHYLLQCPLYRNARIQLCINIIPYYFEYWGPGWQWAVTC